MRRRLAAVRATAALVMLVGGVFARPLAGQVEAPSEPDSPVAFWQGLGDSTLTQLIAAALEANPTLHAADARVRGAQAERFEAALDLAPTVTAVGAFTRQQSPLAFLPGAGGAGGGAGAGSGFLRQDMWEAGIQASWELDAFGRVRNSLAGRGAMLDAAEADVDDARVLLATEVAAAYFRLRGEQDRLAVARRNAENQRRTLDVTLDRLEGGQGTGLDTERARAQLSSTLATISGLEASAAAQEHRIEALVGRDVGPLLDRAEAEADAEADDDAALSVLLELPVLPDEAIMPETDDLVRQRADLRGAARRVVASEAFAGAVRSAYLPRIYIQGAAGYTAGAFDALGSSGTPRYAVGPVVSWPLLDLGRVKAQADGAQARQAEARAGYQGAVLRAVEEVETSRVAYDRARERLQHLEAAAAASERATELARLRFDEGATGFLEVLDAERTQLEAQDRLAVGRTEAAQAAVAVYRALGGRWPGS